MAPKIDAILYSAKLNILRGKVNVGELAEFVLNLQKNGMKIEETSETTCICLRVISASLSPLQRTLKFWKTSKKGLISREGGL
ncbi:MAG: hypothetical protein QXE06_08195 [Candidatus Bathyarchaeia archaeon]